MNAPAYSTSTVAESPRRHPAIIVMLMSVLSAFAPHLARGDEARLERGTPSGVDRFQFNAFPSVARFEDGSLLCAYSARDEKATEGKAVIAAVTSHDQGKTWSAPRVLIDSKPELDYDPCIIVIKKRVIVASTTVPPTHSQFISTSRTVAVHSDDNGQTWSKPTDIPMGHRYTAGRSSGMRLAGPAPNLFTALPGCGNQFQDSSQLL